jgi:hypothetical protein
VVIKNKNGGKMKTNFSCFRSMWRSAQDDPPVLADKEWWSTPRSKKVLLVNPLMMDLMCVATFDYDGWSTGGRRIYIHHEHLWCELPIPPTRKGTKSKKKIKTEEK